MSDKAVDLSKLRAATDAQLLRDAKRQFAWLDVLFAIPAAVLFLWLVPGRGGAMAAVLLALVVTMARLSARLDAVVTLLERQQPKG